MNKFPATILALAASSVLPAVLLAAFFPLSGNLEFRSFIGSFFVALPFSLAANIILGVPAFIILRKFWIIKWWTAALAGIALGAIISLLLRFPRQFDWHDLVTIVPVATLSALTFWSVWQLGRE